MRRAGKQWGGGEARGFTIIEVMIAVAIMAILVAVALPPFVDWRNTLGYRQTARGMTAMLREARSLTITRNQQHMVVFKPNSSSYTLLRGNQAYNTQETGWTQVQTQKSPANTAIRSGSGGTSMANVSVQFNPNGTVRLLDRKGAPSDGTATINEGTAMQYQITVTPSGMITTKKK
ncbi:GspH/FimT family pseudopilin [Geobacter sp.]|uniref:GspH/FimT family pseudopilin n=1 Tax=Geobacter sp. TaxID=46610 RepID=UPI0027B8AB29|nr:GspH/FimT family pseudopilin [Geobacter sp.]